MELSLRELNLRSLGRGLCPGMGTVPFSSFSCSAIMAYEIEPDDKRTENNASVILLYS